MSATIGKERLADATAWLKANGKKGIIGETAGGPNAQCIQAVQGMLQYMKDNSDVWTGWLWWGAGPWWADYMYGMEPPSGTAVRGICFFPLFQLVSGGYYNITPGTSLNHRIFLFSYSPLELRVVIMHTDVLL